MRSFISAILLHGDIIFDTIRFRARFVESLRTHSHIQDQENVGDQFVKGIERTGRVYFNYFARYFQYSAYGRR